MEDRPPRVYAFILTVVAGVAMALPVWYALHMWRTVGPFGNLILWTTVSIAIFGILTVVVSVLRAFVAPALGGDRFRRDGNL